MDGRTPRKRLYDILYARRTRSLVQAVFRAYGRLFPLERPIFIVGLNRSGTSVFTRMLAKSPEILDWSEANDMWDPVGYPWEANTVDRPHWLLEPRAYTDSVMETTGAAYYRATPGICAMHLHAHRDSSHTTRFLNKSPMNTLRLEYLLELFPDACFISIVRDPRAVIRSWFPRFLRKVVLHPETTVDEAPDGSKRYHMRGETYDRMRLLEAFTATYNTVNTALVESLAHLPQERCVHTRYEDFVADMHQVMDTIDERFGIDKRHFEAIPPELDSRNDKYKDDFTTAEITFIEERCKDMMQTLGYT